MKKTVDNKNQDNSSSGVQHMDQLIKDLEKLIKKSGKSKKEVINAFLDK